MKRKTLTTFIVYAMFIMKGGDTMKTYTIKIEDDQLWKRLKVAAAEKEKSIKKVFEEALIQWLKENEK